MRTWHTQQRHEILHVAFPCYRLLANFLMLFPYGKSSLAQHAGQRRPIQARLVTIQPVSPQFFSCMSCCLVSGVMSEFVVRIHVLYYPLFQIVHVSRQTDQLYTWGLGAFSILAWGVGLQPLKTPHNGKNHGKRTIVRLPFQTPDTRIRLLYSN